MVHIVGGGGLGAWATATLNAGSVTAITIVSGGSGYTSAPTIYVGGDTEVKMVPALQNAAIPFPPDWLAQTPGMIPDILDGRLSGVPDPTRRGPAMIQIGTEGGVLASPALLPNTPVGYEQNKRNIVVLNVLEKTLFMAPAERADVIVDFSNFAGKTVILYNDSPAPVPAGDPRYDFYTGDPDFSATGGALNQGGAPATIPGYGPNTRTIMQFRVSGSGGIAPVDDYNVQFLAALQTALPTIFAASTQDLKPIVPEPDFPVASGANAATATYSRISDNYMTFTSPGTTTAVTKHMLAKTIQELFDPQGRMNATLGVELPFTNAGNQTTVPLGFIDPVTETLGTDETQLWKITHNGVDTHGIHFHLVNVQVINRVGWDGAIRPPDANELGWKETVRMNPLEDIIVAMRAKVPTYPFSVPDSVRPLNVTMPVGSTFSSFDPLTGAPSTVTNTITNFGHEYTWHCHILGHEENDMMRPLVQNPNAATNVLWRNTSTGELGVWSMEGLTPTGYISISTVPVVWTIAGTGDFNQDGRSDILWRNTTTGEVGTWTMNGLNVTGYSSLGTAPLAWTIAGIGDFNGDGKTDVLWRNTSTGEIGVWIMNGTGVASYQAIAVIGAPWVIAGVADFNADGKADILWSNSSTHATGVWVMNGSTPVNFLSIGTPSANQAIAGVGDFNSDVKPDILLRDTTNGAINVWYLDGVSQLGTATIGTVPLVWQISGIF